MYRGELSQRQLCEGARRWPDEGPLVDGEFWFITLTTVEAAAPPERSCGLRSGALASLVDHRSASGRPLSTSARATARRRRGSSSGGGATGEIAGRCLRTR